MDVILQDSDDAEFGDSGCLNDALRGDDVINLIMTFCIRHGLSKEGMGDLLDLLRILGATANIPSGKYEMMKKFMEDASAHRFTRFYCSSCLSYVDESETACAMCQQPFSKEVALKKGDFFVYMPLYNQIKDLLESGYVAEHFVESRRPDGFICDAVDGIMNRQSEGNKILGLDRLTLAWNFDGVPIFKSSCASLWPILATVSELTPSARKAKMLMCGIWFGKGKPLWDTFSKPFRDELTLLSTTGVVWTCDGDLRLTKVATHGIVCDAPARCMVQGTHQFNGAFGCTWCLQQGTVVPKGNGMVRVYPFETNAEERTHDGVIESARKAHDENLVHHNGVKSASSLLTLPRSCGIDIVRSFCVDYMHVVLLGVVRQVLELWFDSKWSCFPFSIRNSRRLVDDNLSAVKPPNDISRTPRTLKDAGHWKASECRNWLLYYSVPLLRHVMPSRQFSHWCLLVGSLYVLLQENIPVADVECAERSLRKFVRDFEEIYGREHMSSNIHALLHLGDSVRRFGPLWSCSAFPFEGFMFKIKKFFSGTNHLPHQVANTFLMIQGLCKYFEGDKCSSQASVLGQKWLNVYSDTARALVSWDGVVGLNAPVVAQLSRGEMRLLMSCTGQQFAPNIEVRCFRRCVIHGSIVCAESHGLKQKRNSFTVVTRYGVGVVQKMCFFKVSGRLEFFIFFHRCATEPSNLPPNLKQTKLVRRMPSLMVCKSSDVICTAVTVVTQGMGEGLFFCSMQPNSVEKD